MRPDISGKVATKQAQQKLYHDKHTSTRKLFIRQKVVIQGTNGSLALSLKRTGPLSYLVQVAGDQIWKCHIDHLRQIDNSPQLKQTSEGVNTNEDTLIRVPPSDVASSAVNDESTPTVTESTPYSSSHIPKEYMYHQTDYHIQYSSRKLDSYGQITRVFYACNPHTHVRVLVYMRQRTPVTGNHTPSSHHPQFFMLVYLLSTYLYMYNI